jgi:hypothetical protein
MTSTEERVRAALRDLAAESQPVPLLLPLMRRRARERRRRRITIGSAVVATAAAIVVGLLLAGYLPSKAPVPAQHPLKEFHLSGTSSTHPGLARMVVTLSGGASETITPYVVASASGRAVQFVPTTTLGPDAPGTVDEHRLSEDGRFVLQIRGVGRGPGGGGGTVVVTNLATGQGRRFADHLLSWAEFSPDGKTLAMRDETQVTLVDVATGQRRPLPRLTIRPATGAELGWSPDGRLLAVENIGETLIVDLQGHIRTRLRGMSLLDGSKSWSPDGQSILGYDGAHPGLRLARVDDGPRHAVRPPANAVRALGWTGDRVVWLTGYPGSQRLVTTDAHGGDAALWMNFDVGTQGVSTVSWSHALSG